MKRAQLEKLQSALQEDARRNTPAFSSPLHQRILDALRNEGLPQPAPRAQHAPAWRSRAWRIGIPLAMAAGLAVAAWIILKPAPTTPSKPMVERPTVPPIEIPEIRTAAVPDDSLEAGKYAYLDRDAQKLWIFVANQLPTLPDPPK